MTSNPIRQCSGCAISSLGRGECPHWSVYLPGPAAGERPAVPESCLSPWLIRKCQGSQLLCPFQLQGHSSAKQEMGHSAFWGFAHSIPSFSLLTVPHARVTSIEMKRTVIGNARIYKWTNTHLNQVSLFVCWVYGLGKVAAPFWALIFLLCKSTKSTCIFNSLWGFDEKAWERAGASSSSAFLAAITEISCSFKLKDPTIHWAWNMGVL